MDKYKLFRLLKTLGRKELASFERYLVNLNPDAESDSLKLLRSIKRDLPQMEKREGIKRFLFSETFPGQIYNDAKMRKQMTRLTHALEDFLIQMELTNDFMRQGLLTKSLFHRSDYKLFLESVENRLKALDKQKKRGLAYFKEKYQLLQSIYYHPETAKFTTKNNYFRDAAFYQECYFILGSLMTGAEGLSRNKAIQSKDSFAFLEVAIKVANNLEEKCPAVISLFKELVEMLLNQEKKTVFDKLIDKLSSTFEIMEEDEQRMALKLLIVYATPFSNKGEKGYTQSIFELYKKGIDNQLLQNGDSPIGTIPYLNIAIAGASVGELEWTIRFIKKYYIELPNEDKLHAFNLCMGAWHYKRGMIKNNRDDLMEALSFINFIPTRSDEKFDLRARSLSLRIVFDLFIIGQTDFNTVHENARNYERHLHNNATYAGHKINAYLGFIRHCRQLARLHNEVDHNKKAIKDFRETLNSDQSCVLKHWLLEKVGEVLPPPAH